MKIVVSSTYRKTCRHIWICAILYYSQLHFVSTVVWIKRKHCESQQNDPILFQLDLRQFFHLIFNEIFVLIIAELKPWWNEELLKSGIIGPIIKIFRNMKFEISWIWMELKVIEYSRGRESEKTRTLFLIMPSIPRIEYFWCLPEYDVTLHWMNSQRIL